MNNKELSDIMEQVDKIFSSKHGTEIFHKMLVTHVYQDRLSDKGREIYDESLNIFDKKECDSTIIYIYCLWVMMIITLLTQFQKY